MVYDFSGTGKDYAVANRLAIGLGEELAESTALVKKQCFSHTMKQGERIGSVFPIYAWASPKPVMDFVKHLTYNGSPYLFAVCTCGFSAGESLERALQKKSFLGKHTTKRGRCLHPGYQKQRGGFE